MRERTTGIGAIDMHLLEEGDGERLVLLLHGFPELAWSWRHQLRPLADAGFRVVAPDMRGFGGTSAPAEVDAYHLDALAGDVLGLMDELGHERAVVVGHDWGAAVAWHTAWTHPERVVAVAGLSVPFTPRPPAPPIPIMRRHLGEDFYIVWFQEPGVAEAALERDVRRTLCTTEVWGPAWAARAGEDAPPRPAFLTEEDLDRYVAAFERTGFTGGLNWYRNLDRNWELTGRMGETRIEAPALFLTGSRDPVRQFMPDVVMDGWVTDVRRVVVEGGGHWIQQERPDEVTEALLGFLSEVAGAG
jgi:pimeloyl-ACP methyl ester carboxylesterase